MVLTLTMSQSVPTGPYIATEDKEKAKETKILKSQSVPTGPYIATMTLENEDAVEPLTIVSIGPNGTVHCNVREVLLPKCGRNEP